jgi:hypothetical protein
LVNLEISNDWRPAENMAVELHTVENQMIVNEVVSGHQGFKLTKADGSSTTTLSKVLEDPNPKYSARQSSRIQDFEAFIQEKAIARKATTKGTLQCPISFSLYFILSP